jgi:Retroviral aspartyl protease
VVLRTSGIDVILGMDWMKKHQADIKCQEKIVEVTSPKGERISVDVAIKAAPAATMNQMSGMSKDRVVEEFPDVFPEDLPGMPPDRDIEFIIE